MVYSNEIITLYRETEPQIEVVPETIDPNVSKYNWCIHKFNFILIIIIIFINIDLKLTFIQYILPFLQIHLKTSLNYTNQCNNIKTCYGIIIIEYNLNLVANFWISIYEYNVSSFISNLSL